MSSLRMMRSVPAYVDPKGRKPPHDANLERDIIATVIGRPNAIEAVVDVTREEHFFTPAKRAIWRACAAVVKNGEAVSHWAVRLALQSSNELELAGGEAGFTKLVEESTLIAKLEPAAIRLRELWRMRTALEAMWLRMCDGYLEPADVQKWLDDTEAVIAGFAADRIDATDQSLGSAVTAVAERLMSKTSCFHTPSHIGPIDTKTDGLFGGDLTFIGARPGTGKTALVSEIAINVGQSTDAASGLRNGVFMSSIEMSRAEISERAMARELGIDCGQLRLGKLDDREHPPMLAARERLEKTLIEIDDAKRQTPRHVRARARAAGARWKKNGARLALVVVDYLQLLDGRSLAGEDAKPHELIDACAKFLSEMAEELGVPVLCCARMNRAGKFRGAPERPTMDDFYGSSGTESHADAVWILHRASKNDRMDLDVAKARNGRTGRVFMRFERGRFLPPDPMMRLPESDDEALT